MLKPAIVHNCVFRVLTRTSTRIEAIGIKAAMAERHLQDCRIVINAMSNVLVTFRDATQSTLEEMYAFLGNYAREKIFFLPRMYRDKI